jgi:hypothetical protein
MTQSAFVHAPSSSRNLNLHITPNWGVSWELGIIFGVLYILLVGTWRRLGLFGLLSFRLDGNPGKSYVRQSYVPGTSTALRSAVARVVTLSQHKRSQCTQQNLHHSMMSTNSNETTALAAMMTPDSPSLMMYSSPSSLPSGEQANTDQRQNRSLMPL